MSEGWAGYEALEFRVRRKVLAELVDQATAAVPSRDSALNVHGCFQVTVEPGWLQLTATNTQLTVFAGTKAVDADGSGVIYVPAKRLKEIAGAAPDGDIEVAVRRDCATVIARPVHWDVKMPPPRGYSELPDLAAIGFARAPRRPLLTALKTIRHAACRDAGRPHYYQVRIAKSAAGMSAAAFDSSQFCQAAVPGFPVQTCIPVAMLGELVGLLDRSEADEIEVGEADGTLAVRDNRLVLACQQMDAERAKFPDVEAEVTGPTSGYGEELAVDRAEMLTAIKRVAISASSGTSAMALIADGATLTVATRDDGGNRGEEQVRLARPWSGPKRVIAVNWRFLEGMAAACPAATLEFRLGPDTGQNRSKVRLEDQAAGVIAVIPQMKPSQIGY